MKKTRKGRKEYAVVSIAGVGIRNPQKVWSTIIEGIPLLRFWSTDALKHLYIGTHEFLVEMVKEQCETIEGKERTKLNKYLVRLQRRLEWVPKNRNKLLWWIYEIALRESGMGPLYGFGVTNRFGDMLYGDPERAPLYKPIIDYGGVRMSQLTTTQLIEAASELNEVLGLEPAIDLTLSDEELETLLVEAKVLLVPDEDELTDETWSILEQAGKPVEEKKKSKKMTKKKDSKPKGLPISMAHFLDALLVESLTFDEVVEKCKAEAKERGSDTLSTAGTIRAHIKHRKSQGKIKVKTKM